ncbi:MAG: pimeloyl-ACP methyl ester carboxylesterase [Candidatus Poriferisodalaceae bacterium]|jgi:pimeloyl-ACP methyl ester carboxylesterase
MRQPGTPEGCERIAYVVAYKETAAFSDVYGGGGNVIGLDCHLVRPVDKPSDTVLMFMHPTGGGMFLPIVSGLARQGHHVIWANSRYRGTDSALIMEKVAADLGASIADAKDRLGYKKVVLAGRSGGGSLSMWYQSLAASGVGISDTAAGDVYDVGADALPAVDAVMMLAAHVSRHETLTEWMDASILDERNPETRARDLNLYDAANPNQPPYSSDFIAPYRQAQVDRNRRITAEVWERLDLIRASPEPNREFAFTVHGTMADPRWLDPAVDPSDRQPNWCYLGDPRLVNDGPVGLARFSTLRSWLSQWSIDHARCDAQRAAAAVDVPVLVIGNTADDACTPSHTHRLFDAVGHDHKTLHQVQGATHYYGGPDGRAHLTEAVDTISRFLATHDLSSDSSASQ